MKTKKKSSPAVVAAPKLARSLPLTRAETDRDINKLRQLRENLEPFRDEADTSARSDLIGRD